MPIELGRRFPVHNQSPQDFVRNVQRANVFQSEANPRPPKRNLQMPYLCLQVALTNLPNTHQHIHRQYVIQI